MKIAIDARMYGLEHAGIGRYIINLIDQLQTIDSQNDYFIFLRKKYFRKLKFKNPRFKKILANYSHYSLTEQIKLPFQLFKVSPDLTHFPHFNLPIFWWGKYVVTIHDLIKHESRGLQTTTKGRLFYLFKYLNYQLVVWLAVKRAQKIITPSQWWKKELVKRYRLSSEKIVVTYEGVAKKFSTFSRIDIFKKYHFQKPFVIYTGSLYPHKNIGNLVLAVKKLNLNLVIVSSRNIFFKRFQEKVRQLEAENLVKLVGFVPDEELGAFYCQAKAFVFPSLLEGFGLPGLEAMACGLPVLAADIPVFREIYGDAVLYFNPYDANEIAEKIKLVLQNEVLCSRLIRLGKIQSKKYSWRKMAKETLAIYKSANKKSSN